MAEWSGFWIEHFLILKSPASLLEIQNKTMKKIILERNLEYGNFEDLIYVIVINSFVFLGVFFFESSQTAIFFECLTGFILVFCLCLIFMKKGLIVNKNAIYRGFFLFGFLMLKTKNLNPGATIFTLLKVKNRQKYIRTRREPNMEYTIDSFNLYFLDDEHAHKRLILKFIKEESALKTINFLVENTNLKFEEL